MNPYDEKVKEWALSEGYLFCESCDENDEGCGWVDHDDKPVDIHQLYHQVNSLQYVVLVGDPGDGFTAYITDDTEFDRDIFGRDAQWWILPAYPMPT